MLCHEYSWTGSSSSREPWWPCNRRSEKLFKPYELGPVSLPGRIVMAPLTRNRPAGMVPGQVNATYYVQRASAGLIISEATQVTPMGQGYPEMPGNHSEE